MNNTWAMEHSTDAKFELLLSLNAHNSANKVDLLILAETFCNSWRPNSFYQVHGYDLFRKKYSYLLKREMVLLGDFNVDFQNANQVTKHHYAY